MKKQLYLFGAAVLIIGIVLSGCEQIGIISSSGEITYIDLEGGFYGIVTDDGKQYDPINLPEEFQEDGLYVSFTAKILHNQASTHMWGTLIKILQIELADMSPSGYLINYSGCREEYNDYSSSLDCIDYSYDTDNTLYIQHINAGFNCCPNITADLSYNNHTITIEEIELSGDCDCLCLFEMEYKIIHLTPGTYTIHVIEPYVHPDDEKLEFTVNLTATPHGNFCVEREYYPWGQ